MKIFNSLKVILIHFPFCKRGIEGDFNRLTPPVSHLRKIVSLFLILFVIHPLALRTSNAAHLTLKDEVGREVSIPFPPRRVVSLAPNITEILFSLGLDEEVVGVSIHCNYPEKVKNRVRVGSYISIDFERVIHLKPDLVIATGAGNPREVVERLEKLGFPVFVVFPKRFDDVLQSLRHISQVVGREREALTIVSAMQKRKERVMEQTKDLLRPKVFLQIGESPIVTVGRGTFGDDLIRLAGGENVAGKEREMYPRLGMEEILKRSPEVILISSMNPKGDYERVLREWERWKMIPAVKQGRVHLIDSDLIDRPSPRLIEGLEEMARLIHPERFKKTLQH